MADDIQIFVKVVGQKDIISTTNSLNKMESGVKRLSKDLSKGRISGDQYSTGLKELRRGVDSLFPSWQKAKTAVDQYSKGLIKATADQAKSKAAIEADKQATKAYTQARREATQEDQRRTAILKANRDALNAQRVATEANTAQVHRYRMASDAVYAAEQKLLQLKKTLRTEVANDNMTMREAAAVQMQYKQSLNQVSAGLQQGRNRMSSMGVVTQQAGYQIGDFIVQVQGGQSALVAFSQQATQMVGFLPLMAGKLGITAAAAVGLSAALGIGIPIVASLGMIFLAARGKTDKAAESTKGFEEALKSAREEVKGMEGDLRLLQSGFENTFQLGLSDSIKVAEEKLKEARENLLNTIAAQTGMAAGAGIDIGAFFRLSPEDAEAAVKAAEKELEAAKRTAWELQNIKDIREQTVMVIDSQAEAAEAARAKAEDHLALIADLEDKFGEATVTAFRLLGVPWEDMAARLGNVADEAGRLASNLEIARSFGQGIGGEFAGVPTGVDPFGGGGDYRYDLPSTFKPPKKSKGRASSGGGAAPKDEAAEAIIKLQEQLTLQEALVGKTEAQRQVIQALGVDYEKIYGPEATGAIIARIEALKAEEEQIASIQSVANTMKSSMSDAFMSMIEGTKSFKDSMKDMARAVIKQLLEVLVVQKLVGSFNATTGVGSGIVGAVMGAFQADGGAWQGGSQIKAYANGGVVGGPTYFPMSGGKTGLMGEAGPEAIMPLKRGANGKLGVQMEGGGGDNVVINQSFNFQANGDDSVKKLIAQAAPKIAQMTKSSMLDDRRRGGQTKSVFG